MCGTRDFRNLVPLCCQKPHFKIPYEHALTLPVQRIRLRILRVPASQLCPLLLNIPHSGSGPGKIQVNLRPLTHVNFMEYHYIMISNRPGFFFGHFEKKSRQKKTQGEKKLKQIFEKLKLIIQKLNNLPTKN